MASRYETLSADLETHQAQIRSLWVNNLQGMSLQAAADKWQHGYVANPQGMGAAVLLWQPPDPQPLGVIGLHPRRGVFGDTSLAMANLADFAVLPAHRTLGPAVMMVRSALAHAAGRFAVVYGLPNHRSIGALKRAGLLPIGTFVRYAKPLRFRGRGGAWGHAALGGLPAPLADMVLALADGWRRLRHSPALRLQPAAFDDPALDALWAQRPPHLLLGERTAQALRWRFEQRQEANWHLLLARTRQGDVVGQVVWRQRDQTAEVGDFFCLNPGQLSTPLLLALANYLRGLKLQAVSLSYFGHEAAVKALQAAGFVARSSVRQVFATPAAVALAPAPTAWYLTPFDEDAD